MSIDSIGRETSGMIWFASEQTQTSENARSGGIPALRRMEANAWQREKGPDDGDTVAAEVEAAAVAAEVEAAAAPPARVEDLSEECME